MSPETYSHPEKHTNLTEDIWDGTERAEDALEDDLHVSVVYYQHVQREPDGRHIDGYACVARYRDEDCAVHITSANSRRGYSLHIVGPGQSSGPVGGPQNIELKWETARFIGAIHRCNIPYNEHPLDWFAHHVSKVGMPKKRAYTADDTMIWLEEVIHSLRHKGAILQMMYRRLLAERIFRKPNGLRKRMERGLRSSTQSAALALNCIPALSCTVFSSRSQSCWRPPEVANTGRIVSASPLYRENTRRTFTTINL